MGVQRPAQPTLLWPRAVWHRSPSTSLPLGRRGRRAKRRQVRVSPSASSLQRVHEVFLSSPAMPASRPPPPAATLPSPAARPPCLLRRQPSHRLRRQVQLRRLQCPAASAGGRSSSHRTTCTSIDVGRSATIKCRSCARYTALTEPRTMQAARGRASPSAVPRPGAGRAMPPASRLPRTAGARHGPGQRATPWQRIAPP
jgi:hypothetical protein